MDVEYILAVTNGSACCNMGRFRTADLDETEKSLLSAYAVDGPRFFWEACTGRLDLEEIISMCQHEHIVAYLLDGEQLTKYSDGADGKYEWTDMVIGEISGK